MSEYHEELNQRPTDISGSAISPQTEQTMDDTIADGSPSENPNSTPGNIKNTNDVTKVTDTTDDAPLEEQSSNTPDNETSHTPRQQHNADGSFWLEEDSTSFPNKTRAHDNNMGVLIDAEQGVTPMEEAMVNQTERQVDSPTPLPKMTSEQDKDGVVLEDAEQGTIPAEGATVNHAERQVDSPTSLPEMTSEQDKDRVALEDAEQGTIPAEGATVDQAERQVDSPTSLPNMTREQDNERVALEDAEQGMIPAEGATMNQAERQFDSPHQRSDEINEQVSNPVQVPSKQRSKQRVVCFTDEPDDHSDSDNGVVNDDESVLSGKPNVRFSADTCDKPTVYNEITPNVVDYILSIIKTAMNVISSDTKDIVLLQNNVNANIEDESYNDSNDPQHSNKNAESVSNQSLEGTHSNNVSTPQTMDTSDRQIQQPSNLHLKQEHHKHTTTQDYRAIDEADEYQSEDGDGKGEEFVRSPSMDSQSESVLEVEDRFSSTVVQHKDWQSFTVKESKEKITDAHMPEPIALHKPRRSKDNIKQLMTETTLPPILPLMRPTSYQLTKTRESYVPLPPISQLPQYPKLSLPRKWGVPRTKVVPRTVFTNCTCPPVHKFTLDQLTTNPTFTLSRYYAQKECIKDEEWLKVKVPKRYEQ